MSNWTTTGNYVVELVPVTSLTRTEKHCENKVEQLHQKLLGDDSWTHPIIVENQSLIIMDGHHRLGAAKKIGLKYVPCIKMCYRDPRVTLSFWREDTQLNTEDLFMLKDKGTLLPYKTTRHLFDPAVGTCDIPLNLLY